MQSFSLSHLSDSALDRGLESAVRNHAVATAWLIAHLAESEARRRFADLGYRSMNEYCVRGLRFSEDAADKRIRVARAAHQFPAILPAIADGRLHLTAVLMLAPRLTPANADGLLAAATHRTKSEIELLLAARFPQPDRPERVQELGPAPGLGAALDSPALERVGELSSTCENSSSARPRAKVTPLSPQRYGYEFTGDQSFHDDLARFRTLIGHEVRSGGLLGLLHHGVRLGLRQLERRKYGITDHPRPRRHRASTNLRHIPAEVRRAVVARDGGRCTFVSESGRRCEARDRLEFDHAEPVARGGTATVGNVRLRCRTHNQLEAERTYGAEFMKHKREAAERRARERQARVQAAEAERARTEAADRARAAAAEVVPYLRALGIRKDQALAAAAYCEAIPDASLEDRVKLALRCSVRPRPGCSLGAAQPAV